MTFEIYKCISAYDLIYEICDTFLNMTYNITRDLLREYCDSDESLSYCYRPVYKIKKLYYPASYFDQYIEYIFNTYFSDDQVLIIEW